MRRESIGAGVLDRHPEPLPGEQVVTEKLADNIVAWYFHRLIKAVLLCTVFLGLLIAISTAILFSRFGVAPTFCQCDAMDIWEESGGRIDADR